MGSNQGEEACKWPVFFFPRLIVFNGGPNYLGFWLTSRAIRSTTLPSNSTTRTSLLDSDSIDGKAREEQRGNGGKGKPAA